MLPRPLALTMPVVTVWPMPKGLPMASTTSPTSTLSLSAMGDGGQVLGVDLDDRDVALRVAADHLGRELPAVLQGDLDLVGAVHHVVVGEDVAVLGGDDAGADAFLARRAEIALRHAALELVTEEAAQQVVHVRALGEAGLLGFDGGKHPHDARADLLDDGREAGASRGVTRHRAFVQDEVDRGGLRFGL